MDFSRTYCSLRYSANDSVGEQFVGSPDLYQEGNEQVPPRTRYQFLRVLFGVLGIQAVLLLAGIPGEFGRIFLLVSVPRS